MSWLKRNIDEPPKPKKSWNITRQCLELIFESAKSSFPNEFGGLLRRSELLDDTISELVLLPGTVGGERHAIFRMHMKPIDYTIIGTVHSHPSTNFSPSEADREMFARYGRINIISAYPYTMNSWQAYDGAGNPIELTVI